MVNACEISTQLADELAITPVHLEPHLPVGSRSASQLVQEHILNEARKYLMYTSYSVSEIAYQLHFEYPNYFAKFFRKHTGLSPTEYREGVVPRTGTNANRLLNAYCFYLNGFVTFIARLKQERLWSPLLESPIRLTSQCGFQFLLRLQHQTTHTSPSSGRIWLAPFQ